MIRTNPRRPRLAFSLLTDIRVRDSFILADPAGRNCSCFPAPPSACFIPVNKKFGFTVSARHSVTPNQNDRINTGRQPDQALRPLHFRS